MEIVIVTIVAFFTAILTFFSGFGLGTILLPVFALFFPLDLAIALTGIVHFLNNIFKLVLVGRNADRYVLMRFGIPAVISAFAGAALLLNLSGLKPLFEYTLGGSTFFVTPLKIIISLLMIFFALVDLIPSFEKIQFGKDKLILGGILSGFFGGLSGHQGALRSAFLIKSGLSKEAFIGTSVIIACFVDFTRLSVYATRFVEADIMDNLQIVFFATLGAFAGAYIGSKALQKITLKFIQRLIGILLIFISILLGAGII